jgi:hypothetical protein
MDFANLPVIATESGRCYDYIHYYGYVVAGYSGTRRGGIMDYFRILGAIPGFFLSSLIFMLLWGVIASHLGIEKISYPMAMLMTITLWLVVAPLAAVGRRGK